MRRIVVAITLAIGALTAAAPAQAAGGLLQDLFERFERPAPVVYHYAPPEQHLRFMYDDGFRVAPRAQAARKTVETNRRAAVRKIAGKTAIGHRADSKQRAVALAKSAVAPCCSPHDQSASSIDDDKTLRIGDAYMTPQGLQIYDGRRASAESAAFVDYRKAGIGRDLKARLEAMERPSDFASAAPTAPAKLAAVAYVTNENQIARTAFDASGRKIRVVGP